MKIVGFDQYQKLTDNTAVYPGGSKGMDYLFLGLVGEGGEIANKLKKIVRGDYKSNQIVAARKAVGAEVADCMWYVAQIAKQYNWRLSRFAPTDIKTFQFKIKAESNSIYKYAFRLSFTVSQFANIYATGFMIPDIRHAHLLTTINMLFAIVKCLDLDMEKVLTNNINKLQKRKTVGAIKGSGDKRKVAKKNGKEKIGDQ